MRKALVSVFNKDGILDFVRELSHYDFEIFATKGTGNFLKSKGVRVRYIQEITGFDELIGGRVKTLNSNIFAGILARNSDREELERKRIPIFDLVVVNLYPFEKVSEHSSREAELVENIDIGGVALLRAGAKNYERVGVVSDPSQYTMIAEELKKYGEIRYDVRKKLAKSAFERVIRYDSVIVDRLLKGSEKQLLHINSIKTLRYGENPHQSAFVGKIEGSPSALDALEKLHGKELSYNNYLDILSAVKLSQVLGEGSVVIVKHTNPSGASLFHNSLFETYERALSTDPKSSFGGILAVNSSGIDETLAEKINKHFYEAVAARDFTEKTLDMLFKKRNRRIIRFDNFPKGIREYRVINGVVLSQEPDEGKPYDEIKCMTSRKPSKNESEDAEFGLEVVRCVRSNAVILVRDGKLIGVGAGQMSRVDAARIAIEKAKEFAHPLDGAVMVSDAFFPFPDSLQLGIEVGIKVFVEPGGSRRDDEVIKAAESAGVTLLFTGKRLFRH